MINHLHVSGVAVYYSQMITFGEVTFGDLTFGKMSFSEMTTVGEMTFGDSTFSELTFGEVHSAIRHSANPQDTFVANSSERWEKYREIVD